jgi:hypothetical protein
MFVEALVAELAIEVSMYAFCVGLPGWGNVSFTPLACAHWSSALKRRLFYDAVPGSEPDNKKGLSISASPFFIGWD